MFLLLLRIQFRTFVSLLRRLSKRLEERQELKKKDEEEVRREQPRPGNVGRLTPDP